MINIVVGLKNFRPSLNLLAEVQPRLETGEDKRHLNYIIFFRRLHELQSKRHHWKNYKFILYLPCPNRYILTIFLLYLLSVCQQNNLW
jgi:hypothetical protein